MELALKLDQSVLNDRAVRVTRCKKNPKPFKKEEEKNSKENGKESGAYKRIKHKESQKERQKGSGWITKMKKRNKESQHKPATATKVSSFAGETTGANVKVFQIFDLSAVEIFSFNFVINWQVVKKGKTVKRNKEDHRKKLIAAKLSSGKKQWLE